MSTSSGSTFRRRVVRVLALGGAATLLLSACNIPSNEASDYDAAVRTNFIDGCTGNIPQTDGTTTTLAPAGFCECAYDVFVDQVPFNDDRRGSSDFADYPEDAPTFVDFNNELGRSDDPAEVWGKLPPSVRESLETCPLGPGPIAPQG